MKKSKLDIADLMTRVSARQFLLMDIRTIDGGRINLVWRNTDVVAAGPLADFEVLALLAKLDQDFREDTCTMHTRSRRWVLNRTCTCAAVFRSHLRRAWEDIQAAKRGKTNDPAA